MIELIKLDQADREQFIKDNQEAFNYGAMEEFGIISFRKECSSLRRG